MDSENQINSSAHIWGCKLGTGIKVYKNANVKDSILDSYLRIGDDTIIYDSHIGNNVEVNRRNLILNSVLGRYSYTGVNTVIRSANIGAFCSISWNVSIGGADHTHNNTSTLRVSKFDFLDHKNSQNSYEDYDLECKVGNDVLISTNVILLRGITVGDGAIIGAGAVITKNVEPYSIVAGVPAKKLKMRFSDEIIKELLEIKWWNWPIEIIREHRTLLFSMHLDKQTINKIKQIGASF